MNIYVNDQILRHLSQYINEELRGNIEIILSDTKNYENARRMLNSLPNLETRTSDVLGILAYQLIVYKYGPQGSLEHDYHTEAGKMLENLKNSFEIKKIYFSGEGFLGVKLHDDFALMFQLANFGSPDNRLHNTLIFFKTPDKGWIKFGSYMGNYIPPGIKGTEFTEYMNKN